MYTERANVKDYLFRKKKVQLTSKQKVVTPVPKRETTMEMQWTECLP